MAYMWPVMHRQARAAQEVRPCRSEAGVRVTNGLVSFMYLMTSSVVILTYAAGSGHPVQTPTGLADADRLDPFALNKRSTEWGFTGKGKRNW